MARQKPWLPRLPLILQALEDSREPSFRRTEIEQLFQIGRSAAKELMNVAGLVNPGPGLEATVSRENLLHYLRHSPDAQNAMQELGRRKRLADTLAKANEDAKLRSIRFPITQADEYALLRDLPNVSIEPGRLTVVFDGPIDLMEQLYRLAKAARNEWAELERMCAPADPPSPETPSAAGATESQGESQP